MVDLRQFDRLCYVLVQVDGKHCGTLLVPLVLGGVGEEENDGTGVGDAGIQFVTVTDRVSGEARDLRKDLFQARELRLADQSGVQL